MSRTSTRRATVFAVFLAAALAPAQAAAGVRARCTRGCEPTEAEQGVNLILRTDPGRDVTLTWESDGDPAALGGPVVLFAGNPAAGGVSERGALDLRKDGNVWRASRDFRGDELGSGTFLAVAVAQPAKGGQVIVDWRAFRLQTTAELARSRRPPRFDSALSVDVKPALLTASTGHGDLPPRRGGDLVWWAFDQYEGNTADLDLDGKNTGIPGLGVQVANPWHTGAGEDWKDRVRQLVTQKPERTERFEDFEWMEQPDRTITVEGTKVELRNYYTVITLYTAASSQKFSERDAGGHNPFIDPSYFSHETSASLDPPYNPQFWASYDERVHGTNQHLLGLLRGQVRATGEVPGLGKLQTVDGDGGLARYTVGFWVQVRPWQSETAAQKFRAGVVAMDLVAARVGVGGAVGLKGDERSIVCKVIGCGQDGGKQIDLYSPPSGYSLRGAPYAALGTIAGALRLSTDAPVTAPRLVAAGYTQKQIDEKVAHGALPDLPDQVRFGLTADFRAGLLTKNAWWGKVADVYPINTYAQYVVRITVATLPETTMVVDDTRIFPAKVQLAGLIQLTGTWWDRLKDFFALSPLYATIATIATILALLVVASIFVPGLRPFVGAVVKVATALLRAVGNGIEWIADRIGGRKKPSGTPGPGPTPGN